MTSPSPLHLTIRFSTSLPDVDLDIPSPQTTTIISLKRILRQRLSSKSRLRLIHQGRLLPDTAALSTVLKPLLPPPSSLSKGTTTTTSSSSASSLNEFGNGDNDLKGKGKAALRPPISRLYVNCSIGDELSPRELRDEEAAALRPPLPATAAGGTSLDNSTGAAGSEHATAPVPSVRPRPRGFDRLLDAGFTQSEVSTLRAQFASIHADRLASSHEDDDDDDPQPPSPSRLRELEDAWIDSNAGDALPTFNPDGTTTAGDRQAAGMGSFGDEAGMASMLDVLVKGMIVGFFFPLGSLAWLLREGIWSDKWRVFVGSGVMISVTIGAIMSISGDR